MDMPILSVLLALGGKTLLNWAVVLAQKRHMGESFLGAFCMSLAAVDALLFLSVSAIFLLGDVHILGLRLTWHHHICTLVYVACLAYGLLHWPVVLLAGLDYCCTLPPRPRLPAWIRAGGYPSAACLVWAVALICVLKGPPPHLHPSPGSLAPAWQCQVYRSPESTQVCAALLLLVAGALLSCCVKHAWHRSGGGDSSLLDRVWLAVYRSLLNFLSVWHAFVVLLVALLWLRVEVPGFLDMSVPWLCFLNSFLICTVFAWRPPGCPCKGVPVFPTFPDGFCDWSSLQPIPPEADAGADSADQPAMCADRLQYLV